MASKLSQVLILFAFVAASLQKKLVSEEDTNINDNGIQNLVEHLKTHAYPEKVVKPFLGKQRDDLSSLLNIHTLNLYIKDDEEKKSQRSGVEEDRICKSGRCGCRGDRCEGNEDREDENEVQQILNELETELDKDPLRCAERCDNTGRCGCRGRTRSEDRDEGNPLRCRYGRCGKPLRESNLKSQIEQYGKKYKINDDLDAIVVDISNFKDLLGKLNGKTRYQDRVDMDYILGEARTDDKDDFNGLDDDFYQLDQQNNDDDVIGRLVSDLLYKTKQKTEKEDPIRPNELAEFFESKKQLVIGNALNFVKNSRGNKDLSNLSKDQQYQLKKVRSEVQILGAKANIRDVERKVVDIILGDGIKSEVLPHNENNNNVYIPRWAYKALKISRDDLRSKRVFPLTSKQKMKLYKFSKKPGFWRRNIKQSLNDYGVPFQLQIEGLGQVNP